MRSSKAVAPGGSKDSQTQTHQAQNHQSKLLRDLRGVGPAMLKDFELLGVRSVEHLATREANDLYEGLNGMTGTRQDPCVLDTFRCAIEQARDPHLPAEQKNWWYWSRLRKASKK